MKKLLTAVLLTVLCTSPAFAQRGPGGRGGQPNGQQDRAMQWVQGQIPNLYTLATTEGPRQQRWRLAVLNHYRQHQSANSAAKERLSSNYKAEDDIYGLVIKLDRATADQRPAIQDEIRTAVRRLLLKNLQDRAERIAKLKKDLEAQEQQLNADRESVEARAARQAQDRFGVESGPTTGPATRPGVDAQPATGSALSAPQP